MSDSTYHNTLLASETHHNIATQVGNAPQQLPQDLVAEQAILGCVLQSRTALDDAIATVRADDFYRPNHATIWSTCVELYDADQPVDAITVAAALAARDVLMRTGGAPYLHTLMQAAPTFSAVGSYAVIIRDRAIRRRVIEAGTRLAQAGADISDDPEALIEIANQALLNADPATGGTSVTFDELAVEALDWMLEERDSGHKTGFPDLDALLEGGFKGGQLVLVAGRPGHGKSTLALDFVRHQIASKDTVVGLISLEMSRREVYEKLLAAFTCTPLTDLQHTPASDEVYEKVTQLAAALPPGTLEISESMGMSIADIRHQARSWAKKHGHLDMLVIDYLQLVQSSESRVENRQVEVSAQSRALKMLARELGIPVVALSQLNRNAETRVDREPQIGDLRESGSLEQDADVVLLIHRPEVYDSGDRPGSAFVRVAKQRMGPTGKVELVFQGKYSRLLSAAGEFGHV